MPEKSIGKEFLEVAIEIEQNGQKFYEIAAECNIVKEAKDVFRQLARREAEHQHLFRDMLSDLGGYIPIEPCKNYEYIKSIANSSIFVGKRAIALLNKKAISEIDAINAGIGFEKDSVLLYSSARGTVPHKDQQIIDMIIGEEQKHVIELVHLSKSLGA